MNNNKKFDKMLKMAIKSIVEEEIEALPSQEELEKTHSLSSSFEIKMAALIKKHETK